MACLYNLDISISLVSKHMPMLVDHLNVMFPLSNQNFRMQWLNCQVEYTNNSCNLNQKLLNVKFKDQIVLGCFPDLHI